MRTPPAPGALIKTLVSPKGWLSVIPVSYTHLAEYRIGRNMLLEGDLLSVYSRVFADTGENGVMMPVKNQMSGTGLRWNCLLYTSRCV